MSNKSKKIIYLIIIFLALSLVLLGIIFWQTKKTYLKIYFFDIGQGDAIYIRAPNGQDVLIDGGPDNRVVEELGKVMPFWDHQLDIVVLTHPHADHVNGLPEIFRRYHVDRFLETGISYYNPAYLSLGEIVQEQGVLVEQPVVGQEYLLGEVKIKVLYPFASLAGQEFAEINNTSIVLEVIYAENKFLLMGDLEKDGEKDLLATDFLEKATVLKVGHHGSSSSSSFDFLQVVKPAVAVIQAGEDNKFNHPHEITLQSLAYIGSEIYRTDQQGNILCQGDGKSTQCMLY